MLHREVEVRKVEGFENQLDEVLPVDFRVQGAFGHQARVFLGLDFHFVLEKVVPDGFHRGEVFDYSAFYRTVRIFGFLGI
jgi:hypothetical protein